MSELFLQPTSTVEEFEPEIEIVVPVVSDEEMTDQELRAWMLGIEARLSDLSEKSSQHTAAVNQFGGMLDFIVKSVSEMGEAIKSQGIAGLLKSAMGKS